MALPVVYSPDYGTDWPAGHRFPMPKFRLLAELLRREGVVESFVEPQGPADRDTLLMVHEPAYVDAFCEGTLEAEAMRRIGLPWSPGLVRRTTTAINGTILTARLALRHGLACNTAGGTHHAFPAAGSGFCIFNDLAIAARRLQAEGIAHHILIVDLDVHQGDGTAAIFADDPEVFTFSMHCDRNFPLRKQRSDLDLALPAGTVDGAYLAQLAIHLPRLLDELEPDLVLYDAGVDPHHADRLGLMAMTSAGLAARDRFVLTQCLGRGIPIATVIGGGYSHDLHELTRRHSTIHRTASAVSNSCLASNPVPA